MQVLFRQFVFSKCEIALIGVVAFIMFVGILFSSGALYSGYHFIDDHEVLSISQYSNTHTFIDTLRWHVMKDFSIRFRPLYNVVLVSQTYFLGTDMNHWIILAMLEGIVSFVLFYCFARQLQILPIVSFLFAGLIHFGGQFTPWYRSLNQENLAMVLIGITLCCLTAKKSWVHGLAWVFAVLTSFQKESFCLLLPAYPLLHCFLEGKTMATFSLREYTRQHKLIIMLFFSIFLVELYCIIFIIGTNQIGYAGFGGGTPLMVYAKSLISSTVKSLYYLMPLTIYAAWGIWKNYSRRENEYQMLIVFSGYVIVSQLALHAKSGIWERYLLPFMLGWALLFVLFPTRWMLQDKMKKWGFLFLCISTFVAGLGISYRGAVHWADSGYANQELLAAIEKKIICLQNTPVLLYINGSESDVGAVEWLKYFSCSDINITIHKRDKVPVPIPDYSMVIFRADKENDDTFFDIYQINKSRYTREVVGNKQESYIILYREKRGAR